MSLFLIILLVIMILPIKFTVENVLVLVNFILPSNIKRKYQNSSFYLNIIKDKKSLLTSKKLSDNFKLKLINKKLLKRLSTEDILNIISNLKKDKSMFNILTNINIFKKLDAVYILDIHPSREKQEDYNNITSDIIINELPNGFHININEAHILSKYDNAVFVFLSPNDLSELESELINLKRGL